MATTWYGKDNYQGDPLQANWADKLSAAGDPVSGASNLVWYNTGGLPGGPANYGGNYWIQAAPDAFASQGVSYANGKYTSAPAGAVQSPQANTVQPGQSGYYGGSQTGPQPYNTNPQSQQTYMDTLMGRLTQPTTVDTNDPAYRQQVDTYSAAVERSRRNANADAAEAAGPYASGALQGTERMNNEQASQQTAGFEADLLGREIQNKRDEVSSALSTLGGQLNNDQQAQLKRELAQLDAQLKQMGITSESDIASQELALKDKLGVGGLNLGLIQALLQNQQFGDTLGFNIADRDAYYNNLALQNLGL